MELEPFWKFDRREQPATQSFPRFSLLLPLRNLFSFFLFHPSRPISFSLSLFLFPFPVSRSFEDSSSKDNFDLIPLDVVLSSARTPFDRDKSADACSKNNPRCTISKLDMRGGCCLCLEKFAKRCIRSSILWIHLHFDTNWLIEDIREVFVVETFRI